MTQVDPKHLDFLMYPFLLLHISISRGSVVSFSEQYNLVENYFGNLVVLAGDVRETCFSPSTEC